MIALKFIPRVSGFLTRSVNGFLEHTGNMNRWNKSDSQDASFSRINGHVLVVKNPKYAEIARICIASFLHFHPKAKITVHCDNQTYNAMKKKSKFGIHNHAVTVTNDQPDSDTWQELKLDLIVAIQNTSDFLMDADLKWNGSLRDIKGITFFVREFRFSENDLYLPLFRKLGMLEQLNNSMKNTSFFTWQGNSYGHATAQDFSKLRKGICDSATHLEIANDQRDSFLRISEQLAISLLIPDEVSYFLKSKDTQFDGGFVESSYFGATGTRFSKFGITSRRFG